MKKLDPEIYFHSICFADFQTLYYGEYELLKLMRDIVINTYNKKDLRGLKELFKDFKEMGRGMPKIDRPIFTNYYDYFLRSADGCKEEFDNQEFIIDTLDAYFCLIRKSASLFDHQETMFNQLNEIILNTDIRKLKNSDLFLRN